MVHADAAVLPEALESGDKASFYEHVGEQLQSLLDNPSDSWISATAQASNLLYHAYRQSQHFGYQQGHAVNWVGFYIVPNLLYHAKQQQPQSESPSDLRLGPFSGKPACQRVSLKGAGVGVCAQAFLENKTVLVPNVHDYPGHIACDSLTNSEIVVPLRIEGKVIGVFDLDCERVEGFDQTDQKGLEAFVNILSNALDPLSWK